MGNRATNRDRVSWTVNGWTEEEKETVRREYPVHGRNWDGWVEVLPGRTRIAVADMAHSLGIKGPSEAKRGDEGRCGPWDL